MATSTPLDVRGLPGRYQPRKIIADTPYGQVLEAIDRDCNTAVALKLLRADGTRADVARAMFRREVEALQGMSHAAIVQILDWFECDGDVLCIVLELIPGGRTLARLYEEVEIRRLPRPPLEWRVRMAACLAEAVLAAHRRGVIHRDIKPGNVLWNRDDDELKLADFGIDAVLPLTVRDPSGLTLRSFTHGRSPHLNSSCRRRPVHPPTFTRVRPWSPRCSSCASPTPRSSPTNSMLSSARRSPNSPTRECRPTISPTSPTRSAAR
ncbi:MAG: protein kinase [Nannocystis sp.]|nr:protein kinase [Nannocystis sp.]